MAARPRQQKPEFHPPQARFLVSAVRSDQYPPPIRPEVAFAGRSNVGKSTLLNKILNRRKLARTGNTPGRTQTINFFDVGGDFYFVDLPGYGYAKVPMAVRANWQVMVESYLSASRDIRLMVLLQDIRREPGPEEASLLEWLNLNQIPALIVVTKADKISRGKRGGRVGAIKRKLGLADSPILFSSISGEGRADIWEKILEACQPEPLEPESTGSLE